MTASENSSSLNQGLDQWPLPGNRYFRFGSVAALQRVTKRHQAVTGQLLPYTSTKILSFGWLLLSIKLSFVVLVVQPSHSVLLNKLHCRVI
jgi:hypothetical protein